jgi:hypothetical protein
MSELGQAVSEADAMEAALAAPLFDGVRAQVDAVLNGDASRQVALREYFAAQINEDRKRAIKERDEANQAREQAEQALADIQTGYRKLLADGRECMPMMRRMDGMSELTTRDSLAAYYQKIAAEMTSVDEIMGGRPQAALKREIEVLRAIGQRLMEERDEARHARGQMELRWQAAEKECALLRKSLKEMKAFEAAIRACQATHPGEAWCEKCR